MGKGAASARGTGGPAGYPATGWGECVDLGPGQLHSLGGQALSILIWEHRPLRAVNCLKREESQLESVALGKLRPEDWRIAS